MINYLQHFLLVIGNYKLSSFVIIFFELIYVIFYDNYYNKIYFSKNKKATSAISIPFYIIKVIENFINNKKIIKICDLGFGRGKNLYYFGLQKKYTIEGIEIDKELFDQFILKNKNKLRLYNNDIFNYNFKNNKFDLLIINDPFINYDDYKKLLKKLINCDYKNYLVFINLDSAKQNIVKNFCEIIEIKKFSNTRNVIFTRINGGP